MAKLRKQTEVYTIQDMEMRDFVVSVTYLHHGQKTKGHKHDYEEGYFFAYGIGQIKLDDKLTDVSNGMFVPVEPNVFHQVVNTGITTLMFICVWRKQNE